MYPFLSEVISILEAQSFPGSQISALALQA